MWKVKLILLAIFLMPVEPTPVPRKPVEAVSELWLDVSIGAPLVDWFNTAARPTDIARLDNTTQLNLLDEITVGRKLLVFKSYTEAERLLPDIADKVDIIGYNLEHNTASPADEQANPVASVQRMRDLADEYDLTLAFGPDHDFALSHGVAIAPFVDIFVLQVQRVQTEPQTVYDFVLPLIPQLREANPDLKVSIQVRTEGDVAAIADLVESLKDELDGVSILTSPDTVPVAEDLVEELRRRTPATTPNAALTAVPDGTTGETAVGDNEPGQLIRGGVILACVVGVGLTVFLLLSRDNR
jgi:hypothetical protein